MSDERRIDPATGREPDDPRHSNDELAGDMGVSSEREGHTGPGQHATDGVNDTSLSDEHGVDLRKGAGTPVDLAGVEFVRLHGAEALGAVAKLHFKNTQKVERRLG